METPQKLLLAPNIMKTNMALSFSQTTEVTAIAEILFFEGMRCLVMGYIMGQSMTPHEAIEAVKSLTSNAWSDEQFADLIVSVMDAPEWYNKLMEKAKASNCP